MAKLTDGEKFRYGILTAVIGALFGTTLFLIWLEKPEPESSIGLAACAGIVAFGIYLASKKRLARAGAWGVMVVIDVAITLHWMRADAARDTRDLRYAVERERAERCKTWERPDDVLAFTGPPRPILLARLESGDWWSSIGTFPADADAQLVACSDHGRVTIYDLSGKVVADAYGVRDDAAYVRGYAVAVER